MNKRCLALRSFPWSTPTTLPARTLSVLLLCFAFALTGCGQQGGSGDRNNKGAGGSSANQPAALQTAAAAPLATAEGMTQFTARSGSKMKIDGTANMIHPKWRIGSDIIGGKLVVGPGFPMEPGQAATPGKVQAKADVFIPVNSLKSVEEDGSHYSDAMDNVAYEHLKADQFKRIEFHLTELTLKEPAKSKDTPYLFEAKGELTLAGVTNVITMPVDVLPLGEIKGDTRLKITGTVTVKMTSFKIEPPAPKVAMGMLKTGDDVKLSFEWNVGHKAAATASAAK